MRATDYISGETFSLEPSAEGWWQTTPAPADLAPYYGETYYGRRGRRRFPAVVEWLQGRLYDARARQLTRVLGHTGRVLDVGCGPGHLLARFRALGWEVVGTEATPAAATIPREGYGLDVRAGEVYDLGFQPGEFDAVVSWHSLEHMRQPGRVLDEMVSVLKPGGLLFVSVPDFGSAEAQANPSAWFHLDVPRHLCHFPAATLRTALERRGLRIEEVSTRAPEYDAFSLLQTWQNRMGLPHNLLYLILKRAAPRAIGFVPRAAAIVLGILQLPLAQFVAWWRARRKTGAVIVLIARKAE